MELFKNIKNAPINKDFNFSNYHHNLVKNEVYLFRLNLLDSRFFKKKDNKFLVTNYCDFIVGFYTNNDPQIEDLDKNAVFYKTVSINISSVKFQPIILKNNKCTYTINDKYILPQLNLPFSQILFTFDGIKHYNNIYVISANLSTEKRRLFANSMLMNKLDINKYLIIKSEAYKKIILDDEVNQMNLEGRCIIMPDMSDI